ncbi:hypothetical protein SLS58_006930 [Diplodia intermedia]|uniref:Uncharacterized protein n=1 Tax=Diplodia intermedia TaxID=856260 RepID=A0ABR3TLY6_9PEZI
MIDGGLAQAVTVLTLAVRLAVATQAGTVISMLASISLESRALGGTSLKDGAALSITRYVNSGPLSTAPAFWKNTQWRANGQVFLVVLSVTLFTVVSQFTSTLLLWDVRQGSVLGFGDQRQMDVGFRMQSYVEKFGFVITRSPNYWLSSPPGYPAFAEHSEEPASTSDVFVDTGPSIRALLPFGSENDRRALSEYTGIASVFDTRVICVRPTFPSWNFFRNSTDDVNVAIFNGTVLPSHVVGDVADVLRYEHAAGGNPFECLLNELLLQDDQSFKICGIGAASGGLVSSVDTMQNTTLGYTYDSAGRQWRAQNNETAQTWPVELGHAILIISAGDPGTPKSQTDDSDLRYLASSLPINQATTSFTIHERDAWLDFVPNLAGDSMMSVHHPNANISMTMCYDAIPLKTPGRRMKHRYDIPIKATRRADVSEPRLQWDSTAQRFDTRAILSQLLAGHHEFSQRAILDLDVNELKEGLHLMNAFWDPAVNATIEGAPDFLWYPNSTLGPPPAPVFSPDSLQNATSFLARSSETADFLSSIVWDSFDDQPFQIAVACENCSRMATEPGISNRFPGNSGLNLVLDCVFRDVLAQTANPALAWQALLTMVLRIAYYDWLPAFDLSAPVSVTSMVSCQVPRRTVGFAVVMANLVLHSIAFGVVVFWFCFTTRYSSLGQSWQVVAQLKAPATEDVLQEATILDDEEVEKKMGSVLRHRRLRLMEDRGGERVCLLHNG